MSTDRDFDHTSENSADEAKVPWPLILPLEENENPYARPILVKCCTESYLEWGRTSTGPMIGASLDQSQPDLFKLKLLPRLSRNRLGTQVLRTERL